MLYEYAVEPDAMGDWQSFRYLFDKFGAGEGRLIAKYPESWVEMVWEACAGASPGEKSRIQEKLGALRKKLLKTKRDYVTTKPWMENALAAHEAEPFRAIITKSPSGDSCVLAGDDLGEDAPLWKVERDGKVARTAAELAKIAASLLHHSGEVMFVDQHFSPTMKHIRPLAAFLSAARLGKKLSRIEYHLNALDAASKFAAELQGRKGRLDLQTGEAVIFVRWKNKEDGDRQHPRYVLTNRGGIRFDYGLDEEENITTDWSRLSDELWKERRDQFKPGSTYFQFEDAWKVMLTGVTQVNWNGTVWVESAP